MKQFLLTLITFCILHGTQAQKWWKPTKSEMMGYTALAFSGASYGFNQAIEHHGYGKGNNFVDITVSFKRKYRDYDAGDLRQAYFGSKNILAFTTDAFHLTNTLDKGFLTTGVVFLCWDIKSELKQYPKKDRWKVVVFKKILLPLVMKHLSFELVYNNLPNHAGG